MKTNASVSTPQVIMAQTELGALLPLKEAVDRRVTELHLLLGRGEKGVTKNQHSNLMPVKTQPAKRVLTEAARARIGAAQKRRWADQHNRDAQAAKAAAAPPVKRAPSRPKPKAAAAGQASAIDMSELTAQ